MVRRDFLRLFALTSTGMLLAACGAAEATPTRPAAPTPTAQPAQPPQPTPTAVNPGQGGTVMPRASFAYSPVKVEAKPALAPYSFAVDKVINSALVRELSADQQALLARNGFVVTPAAFAQIYDIYKSGKDRQTPLFVTTDAVLHAYHILYDYVLRSVEFEHLIAAANGLNSAMLAASEEQYKAASGAVKESARYNVAYFALAGKLFDPAATIPAHVSELVQKELALIDAHAGYAESPLFGYKEDYSQYVPRGHYTRNEQFKAFFRGMMWYGRMGFRLKPGATPAQIARGREETRRALLIVAGLNKAMVGQEAATTVWDRIYGPTAFFVGTSDDLTASDYAAVAASVYGGLPAPQALDDTARLDAFIAQAMALPAPRIVSSFVTDEEDPEVVTKSFRFMGQRFIPDSYIFQQLVYDKVGTQGKPRLFPNGLDVLAVFGSQRAYELMDTLYKATAYDKYTAQVAKLKAEFAALPQSDWTQNLYWGWLYALLPLTVPAGAGYPSFMTTAAWIEKDLHTALGSWAELRHDTILYAKQSTTIRATAMMPQPEAPPRGYVEPNAEVYARLAALAAQTRRGLQERGLLGSEYATKLAAFETVLLQLKVIAEKELANQPRSDEEYALIREFGARLENLTTFTTRENDKLSSEADQRMAVIADVHTDSNTKQALEVGVGDAFPIYAIVPVEGELTLVKGGVFSYYEFTVPVEDRLTDEKWQQMSPRPDRPEWTTSFVR